MFQERKGSKEKMIKNVQAELDQFGLFDVGAKVKGTRRINRKSEFFL